MASGVLSARRAPSPCRPADSMPDPPTPDAAIPARRTPDPRDGGRRRPADLRRAGQSSRAQDQRQLPAGVGTANEVAPLVEPLATALTDSVPAATDVARVANVVDTVLPGAAVTFLLP